MLESQQQARAVLRYCRMSPSKVKIVLDLIRNKPVNEAKAILASTPKAASPVLIKLLDSAVANAVNNNNMEEDSLYICEAFANAGPTLKRIQPRAKGMAYRILKRTCHITIVVAERS